MLTYDHLDHGDIIAMPQKITKHEIPEHLKKYVVDQNYDRYSPEDQAVWRFVMSQLTDYLEKVAHPSYLDGLKKTGVTLNSIPRIEEIDKKLQGFGWGAIPVSGFIPPAAFMEFQARGFLPIASDMRTLDHILYTPAPDIVHEAAGHAPILINEDFAKYLKEYASVAAHAIISKNDLLQYSLIRKLSDLKENPSSTKEDIAKTESDLQAAISQAKFVSEAGLLSRMNWWTAEYGLIGNVEDPKIFGAGLLSSLGESKDCLGKHIKKIPLSIDCINYGYDITEPQPQLFVAKDFKALTQVLHELSEKMSFKIGGQVGLERAQQAETVNSVELETGLQISGKLTEYRVDKEGTPYFIKFSGPTQLCLDHCQIEGHGIDYHSQGYSTPLGPLRSLNKGLGELSQNEMGSIGLIVDNKCEIEFASGIHLKGRVANILKKRDTLLLISFVDCQINQKDEVLFQPEWGTFDLATGLQVKSVFGGAADRTLYGEDSLDFKANRVPEKTFSKKDKSRHDLFRKIRVLREENVQIDIQSLLTKYSNQYLEEHFENWLLGLEIIELTTKFCLDNITQKIRAKLDELPLSLEQRDCLNSGLKTLS